jgi:hypothetical protein
MDQRFEELFALALGKHQGEERAEHTAADSGVDGMIDRAGAQVKRD